MLVGDVLAYLDIFSVIMLVSVVGRASTILCVLRRAADHLLGLVNDARAVLLRPDSRHPRITSRSRRRSNTRSKTDDDGDVFLHGIAWA
jgi:hypothetical protein